MPCRSRAGRLNEPLLRADALRKSYGDREVVRGLSLTVAAGEIVGLLGPNGAGKSTTVGMLCGLVMPDTGQVTIAGIPMATDPAGAKRRIGLVPQDLALYEDLPALANLHLFGALYGLPHAVRTRRSLEALQLVGLADRARDKPATFSGGMKRRLNIACALIHDPDILLLDEPTAGVDPQSRNAIFDMLESLRDRGKALVYTTHYMEEAERLCDRVVIIDHGSVIASDTIAGLVRSLPARQSLELGVPDGIDISVVSGLPGVSGATCADGRLHLGVENLARDTPAILNALSASGVTVQSIGSGRAGLEDVFLALTGRQLRD